jgi:hypothetical protein
MAFSDFDALGKSAQMIPPVAAALLPEPTPRGRGELSQNGRRHRHAAGAFEHGLCSFGIDLRLVAERPEGDDEIGRAHV